MKYKFVHKGVFFPEKGILAIGDLHIGFENMLLNAGVLISKTQTEETIKDLNKIIEDLKNEGFSIKKFVFLGDIKYSFGYEWKEKSEFSKVMNFLRQHVKMEDIILIKGNHDTMDLGFEMKPFHIEDEIIFLHGHDIIPELSNKNLNFVVSGHLHPSVLLEEKEGAKKEIYKCFLEGNYDGKTRLILPSFFNFVEGTPINFYNESYWEDFSITPEKEIKNFKVHVIGDKEIFEFGYVKDFFNS